MLIYVLAPAIIFIRLRATVNPTVIHPSPLCCCVHPHRRRRCGDERGAKVMGGGRMVRVVGGVLSVVWVGVALQSVPGPGGGGRRRLDHHHQQQLRPRLGVQKKSGEEGNPKLSELSSLVSSLAPSKTIEIHALTMRLRAEGKEVVSLSVGEPDFDPPDEVKRATCEAVEKGATRYTDVAGTVKLRAKIADDLKKRKGTAYSANEIVVSNGAKQCVYEATLALCGPGDEVLVPTPYWVSYPEIVKMSGATPVFVETRLENGYKLEAEAVLKKLTSKTKMLVLCNPNNPTGACLDRAELTHIATVLEGTGCWVLADEIYERLHYGPERHVSFASISDDAYRRTVVVNGFSKAYAMTGFRLGYLAAPQPIASAVAKVQGQITSCASSISQYAGLAALDLDDAVLDPFVDEFKRRRDFVLRRLLDIAHSTGRLDCPPPPQGAFYVLPAVRKAFGLVCPSLGGGENNETVLHDSTAFCAALLQARSLALVPGDAFGAPDAIRISYAADMATLDRALDALQAFLTHDLQVAPEGGA